MHYDTGFNFMRLYSPLPQPTPGKITGKLLLIFIYNTDILCRIHHSAAELNYSLVPWRFHDFCFLSQLLSPVSKHSQTFWSFSVWWDEVAIAYIFYHRKLLCREMEDKLSTVFWAHIWPGLENVKLEGSHCRPARCATEEPERMDFFSRCGSICFFSSVQERKPPVFCY